MIEYKKQFNVVVKLRNLKCHQEESFGNREIQNNS